MKTIKNYFLLFILTYVVVVFTKYLFLFNIESHINYKLIIAVLEGYKFDFAVSAFIALVTTLLDFNKRVFVYFSSLLVSFVFIFQISDILYFMDSSRHIGYEILDVFVDAKSLLQTAFSKYTTLFIPSLIFTILLFLLLKKVLNRFTQSVNIGVYYFLSKLFLIIVSIFFIRGMFQHIPLNPWQSNQVGNPELAKYLLNGTYNAVYSSINSKKKLKPYSFKHPKNENIPDLYHENNNSLSLPIIKSKPNIVFFFLESWSGALLKSYGGKFETTPNYDRLLKKSLRTRFMIASGHRTTEGMFATLVSFPNPLGKSVAKTQLQNYHYKSIIDILDSLGYSSAFFQGTSKETSGTGSLAQNLGFRKSYGKRDVKKRIYENNYWGVHDVDLYNFVFEKLQNPLKEPFVIGINGATTHDNKIPKAIKPIHFSDNKALNKDLNALHFSDYALGKFIQEMIKKYPNTIFVMFADHCGGNVKGSLKNYLIPFAIYSPLIKPKYHNVIISQRDIAPTVLDLTVGNYKKIAPNFTGKSLVSDDDFFADYFYSGILGWIEKSNLIEINLATNKHNCFHINNFDKEKISCDSAYLKLKNKALSFTYITQKLLFDANTTSFKDYKGR